MKIRRMLVATAALAAASAALAGPASAATTGTATKSAAPTTFARLVGPVVADPKDPRTGYVTAVYRCSGEGHLWVSVKQVEDRSRRAANAEPVAAAQPRSQSMSERLTGLRKELNTLVAMYHHRTGKPHGMIHSELRRVCAGPPTAMATVEQLEERIATLRSW